MDRIVNLSIMGTNSGRVVEKPADRDSVGDFNLQIIASAANPILTIEKLPDAKEFYPMIRQLCIERQKQSGTKAAN